MRSNRTLGYRIARFFAATAVMILPTYVQAQTTFQYGIATVAGNGTAGYTGDGGSATAAEINIPRGVAFDSSGNLYIADEINHRIRMVTSAGTISTVAGNGTAGFTGDGGAATSAELNYPAGIAVDGSGNLFIADTSNNVIRKRTSSGTISTVAGTTGSGYAGDGGVATSAVLSTPAGVAIDASGNLYIADTGNNVIRKVASDGTITTVAGNSFGGYGGDGGPAVNATLTGPTGVVADAAGNLYIADTRNHVVRKVGKDGIINRFAGTGAGGYSGDGSPAVQAMLNYPEGLALDAAGNLYITDSLNCRIRMVTPTGMITTVAGTGKFGSSGDGGPADKALLDTPSDVALGAGGSLYIADSQNNRIRRLTPDTSAIPSMQPGAVISASAFGALASAAPGSWVEIYGSHLASKTRDWTSADFSGVNAPTSLEGTSVTIGGVPAFVSYISPTHVNVQAPSNVGTGSQSVIVTTSDGVSAPFKLTLKTTEPGLWAPPSFQIAGKGYAGAQFSDFSTFAMPTGAIAGVTSRPAHVGETIILYGTGFGDVTPHVDAGVLTPQKNALTTPLEFSIGGVTQVPEYAGLAPQLVGLYQFNVVVPNIRAGDAVPVTFTLGGTAGTQTLYIAVQE